MHLISRLWYSFHRGRELACTAPRSDRVKQTYYEDIREDESVFELIDNMERIQSHDETTAEIELDYFDDITLENVGDAAIASDMVNCGNSASESDAAIVNDLVNGGNSASDSNAGIGND